MDMAEMIEEFEEEVDEQIENNPAVIDEDK
jgi:hypothetical protein